MKIKRPCFLENKFLLDLNTNKMGSIKGKLFDLVLPSVYNYILLKETVNIFESNTRLFCFLINIYIGQVLKFKRGPL